MASMVFNPAILMTMMPVLKWPAPASREPWPGSPGATPVDAPISPPAQTRPLAEVSTEVTSTPAVGLPVQSASSGRSGTSATPAGDAARVAHAAEQAHLAALAARCVGGDNTAWEALVRREQRRVYGLCYRFTGSAADAEDLTQDVFLKVYRNLQSFDPARASFGVWLTALTRNLLVDHYRRSRLERASESLDEPIGEESEGGTRAERLPDPRAGQEQHVAGLELRSRVQAALARVTPELREAVILRDLQDLDYREIAEVLGVPQGTVKSRISRGRAELARLLGGTEGRVV